MGSLIVTAGIGHEALKNLAMNNSMIFNCSGATGMKDEIGMARNNRS
jgi:hypothetical protein